MTSWLETCEKIMQDQPELFEKDKELMTYAQVNICAFVMTNVIGQNMYRYTTNSNIPEEIKPRMEFITSLYTVMYIANLFNCWKPLRAHMLQRNLKR